jgi:transcriptional regulator with XRE-family HTH domain
MWYSGGMETLGTADERPAEDRVGRVLSGLGAKIRRARRDRDMTLEALAEASGTSVAHLSRLESGERRPSLDGLLRLAFGLGVSLDEILGEPEEPGPGTVVRGAEAPFYESWALRFQPLMPEAGSEGLTAVKVVFPADRVDTEHHDHEHGGEEWLYMLKGRLRLTLGNERTVLEPGDAAFFDARLRHRFDVFSEEDAEVLMVSCVLCTHGGKSPGRPHTFSQGPSRVRESGRGRRET